MSANGGVSGRKTARVLVWIAVGIVVLVAGFIGVAVATDASSYCNTCHEMKPYYAAWKSGAHGHEDVACVECHVNPGFVPRLAHKFVALNEVWAHFFGNTSFPLATPPDVPNARCLRCHPTVKINRKNFSHELHASKASCRDCHPTSGHAVRIQALKAAGVYNANVATTRFSLKVATVNGGRANVPGHVAVVCSRCHDMQATGCRACHKPRHKERGDCSQCHKPGRKFVFSHPGAEADCASCHKAPLRHPDQAASESCSLCHRSGGSWQFRHPAANARCLDCHTAPRNHFAGQCASCHRRSGVTWSFAHPPSGEHSWQSIACVKCHPRGYTSAYCSCHDGRPPSD